MSDAINKLMTFLMISPSVVYPDEVLELFEPVETEVTMLVEENAKLRELVLDMWNDMSVCYEQHVRISSSDMRFYADHMHELGIEAE